MSETVWTLRLSDGTTRIVATRERHDWIDDHSNATVVIGYFCEVPARHRNPRETLAADEATGETPREAIDRFCEVNAWDVADVMEMR